MAMQPIALNPAWLMPSNQVNSGQIEEKLPVIDTENGAAKLGNDFGQFLTEAIQKTDELQKSAEVASIGLATGQIQDLHTVMVAMEKASLSLSLTVEARNKVLEAYNEIMRMQI